MIRVPVVPKVCGLGLLFASVGLGAPHHAQAPPRPELHVLRNVVLGVGETSPPATIVLRDGRVAAVLDADAESPPGAREIDGTGLIALPAFVDAYTRTGCETPEPQKDRDRPVDVSGDVRVDMRLANRKGIQPCFRAVDVLKLEDEDEAWRKSGFGAFLAAPGGELLAGTSVLATTREAAIRDVVVRPAVFAHGAFRASGSGYPSTLMGYIAQLRQFFLDVSHHEELVQRREQGRPGLRPPFDADLEAARSLLRGETVLVCEAETARDIERWIGLADRFGLEIAISGGRDAWKVADTLAVRGIPVLLTLEWGDEVDDPDEEKDKKKKKDKKKGKEDEAVRTYEEPHGVLAERRRRWEEGRDCAIRLHKAGVRFAFCTGTAKPKETLKRVRTLVENGLPEDVALDALTLRPTEILGVDRRLGRIEVGRDATLVLWDGDPLTDEKAGPTWVFVDGFAYELERDEKKEGAPDEGVDVTGSWTVATEGEMGPAEAVLALEMSEDGEVTGTISFEMMGQAFESDLEGVVNGTELELEGSFSFGDEEAPYRISATIEGDEISGTSTLDAPFGDEPMTSSFTATRNPEQ